MKPLIKTKSIFAAIVMLIANGLSANATLPYQNPDLTPEERAADLCGRLTLEEKVGLMMNGSKPVPRLGIPTYNWWSEALHGVGRNGVATVFPSCIGMAASFDDDLIEQVFTAVGNEARAKAMISRHKGNVGQYRALSYWTPTVNIFRDPRWGRGQESYGEDPYMNGSMGLRVVRGLQGPADSRYLKVMACAKHFAVHSGPESSRHTLNIDNISKRDLYETYLPAFKRLVQEGKVRQVMCAYQRLDGEACCGSSRLLNTILREEWGYDGIVVTDCGAINDFYIEGRHGLADDPTSASALGVRSGADLECGQVYRNLPEALRRGEIDEASIDVSVKRLLAERFRVGDMDADSLVSWASIPPSVIACQEHAQLARQMAREQMVLLKNNGVLPLQPDSSKIMVMGPNAADSIMCWGIYYGQAPYTVTALQGITRRIGQVPYTAACDITDPVRKVSLYDMLRTPDGTSGLKGEFWNNTDYNGQPAATVTYTSPLDFDNGGNTVFAPGVNLTNFTARFLGNFIADADEELTLAFKNDDGIRIIVNGDTIQNRWKANPMTYREKTLHVRKGQSYTICIEYMQLDDAATLCFDIVRPTPVTPTEIVEGCEGIETVIFVGGISPNLEREQASVNKPGFYGGDRTSIELPQAQRDVLAALHQAGKRVVLVNCSGSAVALAPEVQTCDAILQAWYPGQEGGNAIAEVLFGDYNPSGKLPVTFYRSDYDLPDFEDYRMAGRTYRYLQTEPLFPFGFGLSYTTYAYANPQYSDGTLTVDVTNTGQIEGTEIVQVYVRRPADTDGPHRSLRAYQRVALEPGQTKTVSIPLSASSFECWDEDTSTMRVLPGPYQLSVGPSSSPASLLTLTIPNP